MASLVAYLASELAIELEGPSWDSGDNVDRLWAATPARVRAVLVGGAALDGPVGVACIELAIEALGLAMEADLDEPERLLSVVGHELPADPAWVDRLLAAVEWDGDALTSLERLAALQPPPEGCTQALRAATPRFIALLAGPHALDATGVIEAIAQLGSCDAMAAAVPPLVAQLAEPELQTSAVLALQAIGEPAAIAPLLGCLASAPAAEGVTIARALAALGAREAAPRLLELFATAAPGYPRDDYAGSLLELDPVRAAPIVCRLADPTTANYNYARIAHAGALAGDPDSIAFLERAAEPGSRIRDKAIETLALVKGGAMFAQLAAAAADADSDELVRGQAVAALRRLRDPRAFDAYVAALRAGSHAAATGLAELGDPRAVHALVAKAREVDHYYQRESMMKAAVLDALGDLGVLRDDVWDALTSLLDSSSDHIREHAAIACQQLRPGCEHGAAAIVQKLSRLPNLMPTHARIVDREVAAITTRLDRAARKGPPEHPPSARAIVDALRTLRAALATSPPSELDPLIASWTAWLS